MNSINYFIKGTTAIGCSGVFGLIHDIPCLALSHRTALALINSLCPSQASSAFCSKIWPSIGFRPAVGCPWVCSGTTWARLNTKSNLLPKDIVTANWSPFAQSWHPFHPLTFPPSKKTAAQWGEQIYHRREAISAKRCRNGTQMVS